MNTKTFAQEARKILMQGVAKKLLYWGFNAKGDILEQPEKVSGGYSFRGEVFDDPSVPNLWKSLEIAIKNKGIEVVVEEAAYTWFNRIMALRILVKNGYEEPQLEDAPGLEHTPIILQKARQGKSDFLNADEKTRLQKILADYSKDQEAFAILIKGYCHSHKTLQRVFGKIDDYTELLLPDNMLQTDGFLHLLNTTDAISDEDYQKVELIGWLYQFYISEKKDDVFASFKKGKKAEAKDIPAATQIFTPNWIVKYMVENTAGKIWLDKHPNSALKDQMKYLVENDEDKEAVSSSAVENGLSSRAQSRDLINNVEDLTLIDPAAGSGHILVEGFDLIYKMYLEEYYTPEEAVESILKNNLFGLDIDDRAAQLATFAILLKAAQVYPAIWTKDWLPNVYAMPEAADFNVQELKDFLGEDSADYIGELDAALRLIKQAKNLGSVMKLEISEDARTYIEERFNKIKNAEFRDFNIEAIYQKLKNYIPVLLLLTKKYTSVIANPPYMGQKNMNAGLKNYVNFNYPMSKSDLFAVFMESGLAMLTKTGLLGMINQHVWMFTSTYKNLRENILLNFNIASMLHLGTQTFQELSGEVVQSTAFVLENISKKSIGTYYRLVHSNGILKKEKDFIDRKFEYRNISKYKFNLIEGTPLAYWLTDKEFQLFEKEDKISDYFKAKVGLQTGDNDKFTRIWFETSNNSKRNYIVYNKGGGLRKWYGNLDLVIDWSNDGNSIKNFKKNGKKASYVRNESSYFKEGITWSDISTNGTSFRYLPSSTISDTCAPFVSDLNYYLLGLCNSSVIKKFAPILNPTIHFNVGNFNSLPFINSNINESIIKDNIALSKLDWDSRETSRDFKKSPLLNKNNSLKEDYIFWRQKVTKDFFLLHANEAELNRIFIDIYGLQDELTPEVPLKDITILQEELNGKDLEELEDTFRAQGADAIALPINKAEVISQFISYAIGVFMGRYRLDKPGLNIAHPNPAKEELESYSYNNGDITIDEDAILPLMGTACNFPDDALQQIYGLLDAIWGEATRTENINFIQECLNKDLEKFLVADFYKYHCKMYKKKPIYWLFASKKGAFQVLVYMHRMNAFTVEKIRDNYLLEHIKNIDSEITLLSSNESNLNTKEAKKLEQLRKDLQECYEYEADLKDMADKQITFDLDDGVTVNYKKFETVVAKIK